MHQKQIKHQTTHLQRGHVACAPCDAGNSPVPQTHELRGNNGKRTIKQVRYYWAGARHPTFGGMPVANSTPFTSIAISGYENGAIAVAWTIPDSADTNGRHFREPRIQVGNKRAGQCTSCVHWADVRKGGSIKAAYMSGGNGTNPRRCCILSETC